MYIFSLTGVACYDMLACIKIRRGPSRALGETSKERLDHEDHCRIDHERITGLCDW